jgi:hypothetical protein
MIDKNFWAVGPDNEDWRVAHYMKNHPTMYDI